MTYVLALLSTVVGGFNLYAILSYLNGRTMPLFTTERGALISAFVIALVMCAFGINITLRAPSLKVVGFIAGAVVGIPLLVIFIATLLQRGIPVVHTYRNALIVLAVAMGIKWVFAMVQTVVTAAQSGGA